MKLSNAQVKLLKRAAAAKDADGARFKGYSGRLKSAQKLQRLGLAELMVPGFGLMPRLFITEAGRAALLQQSLNRQQLIGEQNG